MASSRFERLTKTLAGSTSRRQALRALTVAAVGGVIGVRSAGPAYADGNRACAQFCAAVFGDDSRAAGQCTRAAAHGFGLCYTCGPASPGGGVAPAAICCHRNGRGYCEDDYDDATCCSPGKTCHNGHCVTVGVTTTQAPVVTTTVTPTTTAAPGVTTTHAPVPTTTATPVAAP